MRTRWRFLIALLGAACLGACAGEDDLDRLEFEPPETAVEYEVTLVGLPSEEMVAVAEDTLAVYRNQADGAQSVAFLRRRAEGDVNILQRLLRSRGYYDGTVDVTVRDLPPEEAADPDDLTQAEVTLTVDSGAAFTLRRHHFVMTGDAPGLPQLDAVALGSPVGQTAAAEPIVKAEATALDTVQKAGFPYAERGNRRAVADLETQTLEIDTEIAPGPAAVFGPITFEGLVDVRERYLRTYIDWEEGTPFDLSTLRDYQLALLGTDLFATLRVSPPEDAPPGTGPVALPITVQATERPFRTVSAGARFNTDEGPSIRGGYEHRNLFGENETLTIAAEVGLEVQTFGLGYREPQYMRPGQDLVASLTVEREEDDAFDDLTVTGTLGLERRLTPNWIVGAGVLGEASLITDEGEDTEALLAGIPLFAEYDGSDDPLNPTTGVRARLDAVPYAGLFDDEPTAFLSIDGQGSAYYDITGEKAYVLAARTRFASIIAGDVSDVPATRRLYSGGGGSVRGFAQRFVGPLDASDDPIGGLSALEAGLELRARLYGDIGGVVFAEAGSVSVESFPDFNDGVQTAAGVGLRYYSPAGPIRIDVAFPLNARDADDAFQLYFSIGQAF